MVPSGESVQLSARSGSTSDVVTLPSLMAKRVSPRNMNREMAWLCPSVLEWGSRVSGSLAAMFRIFFWASASGAWTSPTIASADSATRHVASHAKRDIEFSPFVERSLGKRDRVPRGVTSIEDHHAERDSSTATFRPSDAGPAHEPGSAIERGQYLVGLRRIQVEDQARHTGVAVALDQVEVLGDAEDRDRQARRIAAGLGDELLEIRQKPEDVAVLGPPRVRHPAVAVGDRPPRAVGKRPAHDHRRGRGLLPPPPEHNLRAHLERTTAS